MTDYYGIEDSDSLFDGPTRDSLVFKGVSYRNSNEMHRAVVADWLSAGGELCRGDIKEFLDESSEDLAATLERDWGLGKFPWFSRDELIGAFERAKANPQSVFEDEDDICHFCRGPLPPCCYILGVPHRVRSKRALQVRA
jgi:hypothetical protein